MEMNFTKSCRLCPRSCEVNRLETAGRCGMKGSIRLARAALHRWEEPCISGTRGSGAVFFSGCPLGCCFCQNYEISAQGYGREVSPGRLAEIFLELQDQGAHNLNLVSPLHFAPLVAQALADVKPLLHIPVVLNSGGYESVETLRMFEGLVDIYLPDIKFMDSEKSARYCGAPDYFEKASAAVLEMFRQTGPIQFDEEGLTLRGLIIRHLVMPKAHRDSLRILDWVAAHFPKDAVWISLMSQYTPPHFCPDYPELGRRISTFEYRTVLEHAQSLGLAGYMQEKTSADMGYRPAFDLTGI